MTVRSAAPDRDQWSSRERGREWRCGVAAVRVYVYVYVHVKRRVLSEWHRRAHTDQPERQRLQ